MSLRQILSAAVCAACVTTAVFAQDASSPQDPQTSQDAAPESLKVYFDTGRAGIGRDQEETLDQAARLFRDGNPIVMIVSGGADTVGPAGNNLFLSLRRAQAVAVGLTNRGIPAERLQILGRGTTELPVETADGVPEADNRIAEITWRLPE